MPLDVEDIVLTAQHLSGPQQTPFPLVPLKGPGGQGDKVQGKARTSGEERGAVAEEKEETKKGKE